MLRLPAVRASFRILTPLLVVTCYWSLPRAAAQTATTVAPQQLMGNLTYDYHSEGTVNDATSTTHAVLNLHMELTKIVMKLDPDSIKSGEALYVVDSVNAKVSGDVTADLTYLHPTGPCD